MVRDGLARDRRLGTTHGPADWGVRGRRHGSAGPGRDRRVPPPAGRWGRPRPVHCRGHPARRRTPADSRHRRAPRGERLDGGQRVQDPPDGPALRAGNADPGLHPGHLGLCLVLYRVSGRDEPAGIQRGRLRSARPRSEQRSPGGLFHRRRGGRHARGGEMRAGEVRRQAMSPSIPEPSPL